MTHLQALAQWIDEHPDADHDRVALECAKAVTDEMTDDARRSRILAAAMARYVVPHDHPATPYIGAATKLAYGAAMRHEEARDDLHALIERDDELDTDDRAMLYCVIDGDVQRTRKTLDKSFGSYDS